MLDHFQLYNGKRRCLTPRMPAAHHSALRELHRAARLNPNVYVSNDQILYVGVRFHLLTPNTSRELSEVITIAEKILQMMNAGFGNAISPLHDMHAIEHGELLRDSENRQIYHQHKNLACSPNLQFVMAGPPKLYHIPYAHKHSGSDAKDMDYWDQVLKLQTAPAIDPEHVYNLWIVVDVKSVLLGYGNFPKINPTPQDLALDGFVYFISGPPYDMHATAVHETGHVYGLQHPFNHTDNDEYDDEIEDTPPQNIPDFGPVWFKTGKWPSSIVKKTGAVSYHNLENWLNYADDRCMFMFTRGQCARIRETALTVRGSWNLERSQVDGLRGGSPWVSARFARKREEEKKSNLPFVTQHEAFPFRKKYLAPNHNPQFRPKKIELPETSLQTFGGMMDLCGSLFGIASSTVQALDTTGKMVSAFSFACC